MDNPDKKTDAVENASEGELLDTQLDQVTGGSFNSSAFTSLLLGVAMAVIATPLTTTGLTRTAPYLHSHC